VGLTVLLVFLVDLLDVNGSYPVHVQAFFATGLPAQCLSEFQWGAFLPHRHCQDESEVSAFSGIYAEELAAQSVVSQTFDVLCVRV
jgi:hypothetical protein